MSSSDGGENEGEEDKDAGSSSVVTPLLEATEKTMEKDTNLGRLYLLRNCEESSSTKVVSPVGIRERSWNKREKRSLPAWLSEAFQTSSTGSTDVTLSRRHVLNVGVVPRLPLTL